jgi:small subunit ribosomal protein S17
MSTKPPTDESTPATRTPRARKPPATGAAATGAQPSTSRTRAAAKPATAKTAKTTKTTKTTKAKQPARAVSTAATQPRSDQPRHLTGRQQKMGRVTSNRMQKTIVVAVESLKRHPIYKRTYKYTTKFKAHDEHNDARIGDIVRIEETRPLSKEKRWRLLEIVKRAEQTVAPDVVEERLEEQAGLTPPSAGAGAGTGR